MDDKEEEFYFGVKRKNNPDAPKSTYAEDYIKVSVKRPDLIVHKPDFPDIVAGPFIDPLLPDSKISDETEWEKADEVYKRMTEKYPSLKKVALPETVDQSKITKEYKLSDKSIYQIDYSNEGESYESKYSRLRQRIKLPPDWGPIPRTTQRRSYREWKKLVPWIVKPAKLFQPPESDLGLSKEEKALLNIKTGKSEYEENISGPGNEIMDYAFYGEVKPLPHEYRRNN
ncbi:uncharacterized protein [Halyomorpha halys]|uniref:uncharacterized protein n=1 Tax=Halyomorpha halys TaxID=286706 RepID=UPI0006D52084|nr:uncharacterized protein LOC106677509 [Halyomorpha halys]